MDRASAPLLGDVYAVLDLAGPAAAAVRSIRARFSYDYLGAMPVEITVTGSGGVGSPTERDDPRPFFAALDEIVDSTRADPRTAQHNASISRQRRLRRSARRAGADRCAS
jgi:hypothetical protein